MREITIIPGDGIGPEVTEAMMRVVDATGVGIKWEIAEAGMAVFKRNKNPLPVDTLNSIYKNHVAIKGPLDTPIGEGYPSVNVGLRQYFSLYANIRPVKSIDGVPSVYRNVDLVIFREGNEDVYTGEERYMHRNGNVVLREKAQVAEVRGFISKFGCNRFFDRVRDYVVKKGRRRVTIVHKANILKKTYGMFLESGYERLGKAPSEFTVDDRIVDNMAMQLVMNPGRFDVIAAPNLFGDILSDLCAGLVGGLGLAPGANIGDEYAIFEAVHGTAPDIAGQNKANPTAMILSACMMLDHIGNEKAGRVIRMAVQEIIKEGKKVTRDINPLSGVSTTEMTDAIVGRIMDLSSDEEIYNSI